MRTIRRLYLYAVAFVSLEVVLWGLIGLARSLFCPGELPCGIGSILARGLALILVGLPVLALHWWLAQRLARREAEEQSSGIRATFLSSRTSSPWSTGRPCIWPTFASTWPLWAAPRPGVTTSLPSA